MEGDWSPTTTTTAYLPYDRTTTRQRGTRRKRGGGWTSCPSLLFCFLFCYIMLTIQISLVASGRRYMTAHDIFPPSSTETSPPLTTVTVTTTVTIAHRHPPPPSPSPTVAHHHRLMAFRQGDHGRGLVTNHHHHSVSTMQ
jgi:hypothetical protein